MEGEEDVVVVVEMAMTIAMLTRTATVMTMAMIDYPSLLESDGMIAAIIYFLFIHELPLGSESLSLNK